MNSKNNLIIVICVDTEGPLTETLKATFERLRKEKKIKIKPLKKNLIRLQKKKINLRGRENEIADFLSPKRLNYLKNWQQINAMVKKISSSNYRNKFFKNKSIVYSWFIIDNVGFKKNPRKKTLGFNKVLEKYEKILKNKNKDCFGWHFHSIHPSGDPLKYNTSWTSNDYHEKSLCEKILRKNFFPSVFRSGAVIERNDINFWLENFIPFDFSNLSSNKKSKNIKTHDWRGAPNDWSEYNPNLYDYRKKGNLNRTIFRTLDIDTNSNIISDQEIFKAFKRSQKKNTILSVSTHDRRDINPEIEFFLNKVKGISKKFPNVNLNFKSALDAARFILKKKEQKNLKFQTKITGNKLTIKSNFKLFGPQPFLAIKENKNLVYRDNPIIEKKQTWTYFINEQIKQIGIAGCDQSGNYAIKKIIIRK